MSKTNVVWEHRKGGGRFMTPYTDGTLYEDDEHHIVVAINVNDAEGRRLCDLQINQTAESFLNELPPELRGPNTDAELREMMGADPVYEGSSDERKMSNGLTFHENHGELPTPLLTLSTEGEIEANNIIFYVDNGGTEILKLCGNGDIFVKGKLVENDKEVVQGLRDFLKAVPKSQN